MDEFQPIPFGPLMFCDFCARQGREEDATWYRDEGEWNRRCLCDAHKQEVEQRESSGSESKG